MVLEQMNNYLIYCDGGARGNPGPAAAAFLIFKINGDCLYRSGKYLGVATNNVAEYQAVLMALTWLAENQSFGDRDVFSFYLDSQLVVNQLNGQYRLKDEKLKKLAILVKDKQKKITGRVEFIHLPREFNRLADHLVNQKIDEGQY